MKTYVIDNLNLISEETSRLILTQKTSLERLYCFIRTLPFVTEKILLSITFHGIRQKRLSWIFNKFSGANLIKVILLYRIICSKQWLLIYTSYSSNAFLSTDCLIAVTAQ